jgi:hypothetical protein
MGQLINILTEAVARRIARAARRPVTAGDRAEARRIAAGWEGELAMRYGPDQGGSFFPTTAEPNTEGTRSSSGPLTDSPAASPPEQTSESGSRARTGKRVKRAETVKVILAGPRTPLDVTPGEATVAPPGLGNPAAAAPRANGSPTSPGTSLPRTTSEPET